MRDKEEAKRIEDLKELASQQKSILGVLYNEKERPIFDKKVGMLDYSINNGESLGLLWELSLFRKVGRLTFGEV